MKTKTTPVQVRLRKETMNRLDRLVQLTGKNRTRVIVDALWIYERFAIAQTRGDCILIEDKSGKQIQIEIIGVSQLTP